jgi:hypothetical protein
VASGVDFTVVVKERCRCFNELPMF